MTEDQSSATYDERKTLDREELVASLREAGFKAVGGHRYLMLEAARHLSSESEIEQRSFSPLERFALTILEGMREHPGDDMDGDTLFDAAEVAGLLCEVKANEPCSEHYCACAEVSDFPVECMRETDYLRGKLAKFRKEKANG